MIVYMYAYCNFLLYIYKQEAAAYGGEKSDWHRLEMMGPLLVDPSPCLLVLLLYNVMHFHSCMYGE